MKTIRTADREFEIKDNRRARNEDRAWNRICAEFDRAEPMIGTLIRDGKTIHYVWPVGGKYREGSKADLINYLIRNNHA
jgi:hypothetical protein